MYVFFLNVFLIAPKLQMSKVSFDGQDFALSTENHFYIISTTHAKFHRTVIVFHLKFWSFCLTLLYVLAQKLLIYVKVLLLFLKLMNHDISDVG